MMPACSAWLPPRLPSWLGEDGTCLQLQLATGNAQPATCGCASPRAANNLTSSDGGLRVVPTPAAAKATTTKNKAQHNFWPVEQEEEDDDEEAKTGQTKGTRRAPENVDSPAWSPMASEAGRPSPSAGRFLCHSRLRRRRRRRRQGD